MKKYIVAASLLVLGTGVALASSLSVPFFLDTGGSGFPPANGNAAFIGLRNNTTQDLTITVEYFDGNGNPAGPGANNTFEITAGAALSFRPFADDTGNEATQVPNATSGAGAAVFTWPLMDSTAVQGRYVQVNAAGNSFSFLLPPGVN